MERLEPQYQGVLSYYDLFGSGTVWRILDLLTGIFFCTLAVVFSQHALFLYGFAAVGGFFALLGLSGLLFKRGVTIDRWRGRVRVWRGFLFPLCFRTRRLERYHTVRLGTQPRRRGRRYTTVFTVQLTGDGRADEVTAKKDYLGARRTAENLAGYLGFDLLDATASQPVRTPAANVGKSLREQARTAAPAEKASDPGHLVIPPPPAGSRCTCTIDGPWLFLEIPRRQFLSLMKLPCMLGIIGAALGFGIGVLTARGSGDWTSHLAMASSFTLVFAASGFLVGGVFFTWPTALVRYQIEAHPGGLTVRWRGLIFRGTGEIPSTNLRELRGSGRFLQAIGRDKILRFGSKDLTKAELEWIRAAITKAIAA